MQLNVPPDLETLINKRLLSGAYTSPEDVLRRALEAQDAQESWTDEERRALSAHIEEGYLQAERGELIEAQQARGEDERLCSDATRQSGYFQYLVPHRREQRNRRRSCRASDLRGPAHLRRPAQCNITSDATSPPVRSVSGR
jgi:hypothetical protein